MEMLVKAAALALSGCVLAPVIKKSNPELSALLSALVAVSVTALSFRLVSGVLELAELARTTADLSSAVTTPVIKCVGLGVVTRLCADFCRDSGYSAVASAVELCGCVSAMCVALPLFRSLLSVIGELA